MLDISRCFFFFGEELGVRPFSLFGLCGASRSFSLLILFKYCC